jgi:hypothetical protein
MAGPQVQKRKRSVPEVAKLWGVSTKKVLHFVKTGQLKAINLAASPSNRPRYAIDIEDIEKFERSREVVPEANRCAARKSRRPKPREVKQFF